MNAIERIRMVRAMEYIARNINDESVFEGWLSLGVADGDIERGVLEPMPDDLDNLDCYIDEDSFADLMDVFLGVMHGALRSGGLFCDGIVSCGIFEEDHEDEEE